jgi:hypothetical protein
LVGVPCGFTASAQAREPAILFEEGEEWLQDIRLAYDRDTYLRKGRKRRALSQKEGFWYKGEALYVPTMADSKDIKLKDFYIGISIMVGSAGKQ